jgi:hypothetical protein
METEPLESQLDTTLREWIDGARERRASASKNVHESAELA